MHAVLKFTDKRINIKKANDFPKVSKKIIFKKPKKHEKYQNLSKQYSSKIVKSSYSCCDTDCENLNCHFTISSTRSTFITAEGIPKKMSQDAEGGPEIIVDGLTTNYIHTPNRPPMNQDEFDKRFRYTAQPNSNGEIYNRGKKLLRHYYKPCKSSKEMFAFITRLIPILNWLPLYSWRNCLLNDMIGGIIVGVMHVPQGIAYANLAGVHAVVGLYTSFLPPFFYMIFGTSRHNSIGSFAVVSLMSGMAVNQFRTEYYQEFGDGDDGETNLNLTESIGELEPFMVSSTLALCVGLIQIIMGVLRFEFVTTYFSDQLVAGFTTGASIHVFIAQLKDVFGISNLPRRTGTGYIFAKIFDIISNINRINPYTFILSIASMLFLLVGKEILNPLFKRRFHSSIPLPWELILMVLVTIISQVFHFHSNFAVRIVGRIPTGFPSPILPNFSIIPSLLPDALGIAAVVIAVHISLAKMFAKKMDYRIDSAQELFALGFSSSLSSFFPVYPVSCSLGRTLVNVEAGTKTQLSTLFSSALLAGVILYFGQWLQTLPMCILSAIIIVALKGILKKVTDLSTLWPLSKIDFCVWLVSFLSTVCLDVTQGLAISIAFALMTTVFRTQWPRWHFLANLIGTNDFRDSERYELVSAYPGICIFRFDSPLLFTNVDNFKKTIHEAFVRWNHHQRSGQPKQSTNIAPSNEILMSDLMSPLEAMTGSYIQKSKGKLMIMTESTVENNSEKLDDDEDTDLSSHNKNDKTTTTPPKIIVKNLETKDTTILPAFSVHSIFYRHFIIDCSGFTFVDCMGVNALKEIFTEMRAQRVLIYFAATKAPVRDLFEKSGFYQFVHKHNFYPTIRDAVTIARKRRNASTQLLLDETPERHFDSIDVIQNTLPMI